MVVAAMVLCAGYGTRLGPLGEELPKALLPIGDAIALDMVAAPLRAAGLPLVVNSHHRADAVATEAARLGAVVSHEPDLLGTAGGVAHAADAIGEGAVLVVNGDILSDLDLPALLDFAERDPRARALLAVAEIGPAGSGTVGLGEGDRVVRLRGERFGEEIRGAQFIGAQVLSPLLRLRLPARGCLVGDVYLPLLRDGALLTAVRCATRFCDIGTPASYLAANLDWLARRGAPSWSRGKVAVAVELDRAIVGAGAQVSGAGRLARVVVWPGAHARAPLSDAIATPRRIVRLAAGPG